MDREGTNRMIGWLLEKIEGIETENSVLRARIDELRLIHPFCAKCMTPLHFGIYEGVEKYLSLLGAGRGLVLGSDGQP